MPYPLKYKSRVKSLLGLLPEVVQKKPHLVTLLYLAQFILRSQHKKTWKVKFSYWNIFSYMCFRLIKDLISFPPKMLFVSNNSKLIWGFFSEMYCLEVLGRCRKGNRLISTLFFIHADTFNRGKHPELFFSDFSQGLQKACRRCSFDWDPDSDL